MACGASEGRVGELSGPARRPLSQPCQEILPGRYEAGVKLVSNVQLFSHLANIGDTRSLIIHPASTTHRQLTDAQKVSAGAGPDGVRLSIGIEDKADIIADLEQALAD